MSRFGCAPLAGIVDSASNPSRNVRLWLRACFYGFLQLRVALIVWNGCIKVAAMVFCWIFANFVPFQAALRTALKRVLFTQTARPHRGVLTVGVKASA